MDYKELNIGVVFEGDLVGGGGYQTQLSTILALAKNKKYQLVAIVFSIENKSLLENHQIKTVYVKKGFFQKIFNLIFKTELFSKANRFLRLKTVFEKKLDEAEVDLVYFLSPSGLALDLVAHNYIFTIWDLCHRDTPEFPEVNYYREFENRENLYNKASKKAIAVLTDSELGKENAIRRYGLDRKRVFNASFAPSVNIAEGKCIDIKIKYCIEGEYIYYPAQFWSHKNHVYIIDAIKILRDRGTLLTAVFSGSDKGNLNYVLDYAKKAGMAKQVKYIGFAPNEELYQLYEQSLALVMPSYFGPTNIPPLEAFAVGTPVFYSDLEGLKEQVGDAAMLCDLTDPSTLASDLLYLLNNVSKRTEMIEKGRNRLEQLQQNAIENKLEEIFEDYLIKMKCWKS